MVSYRTKCSQSHGAREDVQVLAMPTFSSYQFKSDMSSCTCNVVPISSDYFMLSLSALT